MQNKCEISYKYFMCVHASICMCVFPFICECRLASHELHRFFLRIREHFKIFSCYLLHMSKDHLDH